MGEHRGLGWISGRVTRLTPSDPSAKVPHMGWNDVRPTREHPLIVPGEAYFLHSYAFTGEHVLATTDHDGPVTAAIGRDTVVGAQFHPEKSQRYGLSFLTRFLGGIREPYRLSAIDLKGGQVVRLAEGDMDRATVYGDDPTHQAMLFAEAGAQHLHVVDLDGALRANRSMARRCRRSSKPFPVTSSWAAASASRRMSSAGSTWASRAW